MKFDRINKWLTLGANICVVIGLVFLGLEIRQNAGLSRTSIEVQKSALLAQIELTATSPDVAAVWMKSIYHPEEMTDAEIRIVDGYLASVMLHLDYALELEAAGLRDRGEVAATIERSAPFYFGSAFGKNWYKQQAMGWTDTMMSEIADPIIDNLDEDFLEKYYDSLRIQDDGEAAN